MCRHARVSCTTRVTRQHAGVHGALLAHGALLLAHARARFCARCRASVHTCVCSHTHTPACTLPLHTSMFLWGTLSVHTPKMLPPACTSTSRCPHVCTHTHTHPVCSHPALPPDCSVGLRAHAFPLLFLHTCTRTDLPHHVCTRMPTAISVHITSPPSCTHPTHPFAHSLLHQLAHSHPPRCSTAAHMHALPVHCTLTLTLTHSCRLLQLAHTPLLPKHPPLAHACTPPVLAHHSTRPTAPTCTHSSVHAHACALPALLSTRAPPLRLPCTPAAPTPARAPRPQPPARALPRMAAAAARAARCRAL